jgi:hypothetical protein
LKELQRAEKYGRNAVAQRKGQYPAMDIVSYKLVGYWPLVANNALVMPRESMLHVGHYNRTTFQIINIVASRQL